MEVGIVDRIVAEPIGGAHRDPNKMFETVRAVLVEELNTFDGVPVDAILTDRREKFYGMGIWTE